MGSYQSQNVAGFLRNLLNAAVSRESLLLFTHPFVASPANIPHKSAGSLQCQTKRS